MNTINNETAAREAAAKRANASEPASAGAPEWDFEDERAWPNRPRREALANEFAEALCTYGIQWKRDIHDDWLIAYDIVLFWNKRRTEYYKKAKLNLALRKCRELLQRVDSVSLYKSVKEGARVPKDKVVMGGEGIDWLLERIDEYFEGKDWYIPFFFLAGHEEEGGECKLLGKEAFNAMLIKYQAAFVEDYETLRGRGNAKHLGVYVNTFLDTEAPAWAAALNQAERYRVIGELLEKAGILEEYKGKNWLETKWASMEKKDKAKAVEMWGKQAKKA